VKCINLLIIPQLVRVQETLLKSCVQESLWRMLHHVENKADSLLGERRDQIIVSGLLPVDVIKSEIAFG
jgi:hypothetical protein